jgi:hypothetical protein
LYCIAPVADRSISGLHGRIQDFCRVARPLGKQQENGLKAEHQALEALQRGIVKIAGNPGPFVETVLHTLLKPAMYLANA